MALLNPMPLALLKQTWILLVLMLSQIGRPVLISLTVCNLLASMLLALVAALALSHAPTLHVHVIIWCWADCAGCHGPQKVCECDGIGRF